MTGDVRVPETRPRVVGEREDEILDACVAEIRDHGYDRLTMDGVARRARASKATLYRRWNSKQSLVVDALIRSKQLGSVPVPDTGSLRQDLLELFCGPGPGSSAASEVLGYVLTAMQTDEEFAHEFRTRFVAPKIQVTVEIYGRARARGELLPEADPALLGPALAGILLHRAFVLGEQVTPARVARVLDQIILPAATGRRPAETSPAPAAPHDPDQENP